MLNKRQLIDAVNCGINGGCTKCSMSIITEIDGHERDMCGYGTSDWAREALAYRAMLERLEWAENYGRCPVCKEHTHKPDCELAALLKELEG